MATWGGDGLLASRVLALWLLACFAFPPISDEPHKATFLNEGEGERKLLKARIFEGATQARMSTFDAKAVKRSLRK